METESMLYDRKNKPRKLLLVESMPHEANVEPLEISDEDYQKLIEDIKRYLALCHGENDSGTIIHLNYLKRVIREFKINFGNGSYCSAVMYDQPHAADLLLENSDCDVGILFETEDAKRIIALLLQYFGLDI